MKIIEYFLDKNNKKDYLIEALSFVNNPAIEAGDFVVDEENQIVYGAALVPNKLILRRNKKTGEEYYIYFSKDTIKDCARSYMLQSTNKFTTDHEKNATNEAKVVESWVIRDEDGGDAKKMGFNFSEGTWVVGTKIMSPEIFNKIKNKEYNGFSIEGSFAIAFSKVLCHKEYTEDEYIENSLTLMENNIEYKNIIKKEIENLYKLLKNKKIC